MPPFITRTHKPRLHSDFFPASCLRPRHNVGAAAQPSKGRRAVCPGVFAPPARPQSRPEARNSSRDAAISVGWHAKRKLRCNLGRDAAGRRRTARRLTNLVLRAVGCARGASVVVLAILTRERGLRSLVGSRSGSVVATSLVIRSQAVSGGYAMRRPCAGPVRRPVAPRKTG